MGCCGDGDMTHLTLDVQNTPIYLQKIGMNIEIDDYVIRNMSVSEIRDHLTNRVIYQFRSNVPYMEGEWLEVPASWWDHLKLSLRRFKIFTKLTVRFNTYTAQKYMPYFPYQLEGKKTYFSWINDNDESK